MAFWYYLQGYVMIKASGFAAERFLNMASYRGIYLWDVQMKGASVILKAPTKSLPLLEKCRDKTGCRMEILAYGGLPARTKKFHGRQILAGGILLFIIGIYILSSFIWVIRIEGNERLKSEEILEYCKEIGLKPGAWKPMIATDEVTKGLLGHFADISWISVGLKGTDVTIKLTETIEKVDMVDKETPYDIVASMDGVITQITAERGTPLVQAGDVVKKGDVLISSEILIGLEGEEQHKEYVAAEGKVMARIWQNFSDELPLEYAEKRYTGEETENNVVIIAQNEIDIVRPSLDNEADREVLSEKKLGLGDFTLPIEIRKEVYYLYTLEDRSRTVDEAKGQLESDLKFLAEQALSKNGWVEEIKMVYEPLSDRVKATAEVVMIERIDEKKETKESDATNGASGENDTNGE